jgi:hypothetical protein
MTVRRHKSVSDTKTAMLTCGFTRMSSHGIDCHHYRMLISDVVYFDIQGVPEMRGQISSVISAYENEGK